MTRSLAQRPGGAIVLAVVGWMGAAAHADPITLSLGGGWQATIFEPIDVGLAVDHVDLDQNLLVLEKFANFNKLDPITGLPVPVNILFTQVGGDAETVTRIVLTDEILLNNSGIAWESFRNVLLGNAAKFDPVASAGFSIAPFTTTTYLNGDSEVEFAGGVVPHGTIWTPGLASGGLYINVDLSSDKPVSFVLKEIPIPEPTTLMLVLGGALLIRRRF